MALGGTCAAEKRLLGHEDAVAQHVPLRQLEAIGTQRKQCVARFGMVRSDRVEAPAQLAKSFLEDHV